MKKIVMSIIIFLLIICSSTYVFSKYDIDKRVKVASITIDCTPPVLDINYSETNFTEEDVIVTITANEKLQEIEGFILSEDKTKLSKIYSENITENVEIKDLAGNITNQEIKIENIDKEEPKIIIECAGQTALNPKPIINGSDKIYFRIIVTDDCHIANQLSFSDINILVNNKTPFIEKKSLSNYIQEKRKYIYNIELSGICSEGELVIRIPEDRVKDKMDRSNKYIEFDTGIKIEN